MEFEKKYEVQYKNGDKVMHTFETLSGDARNNIFGEYLDMNAFMADQSTDKNPMSFIREGKNMLEFTTAVLKESCPTLETGKVPAVVCDKIFEELTDFIFTGGLKN